MNIQTIKNVSDCIPLYLPHSLYLKPLARFNISVQLPTSITGKTISNWDVMENLRKMISPEKFSVLKVTKSTLETIRFDAEIEDRTQLKAVLLRLDGNTIKLSGYPESAKIRASEAKDNFPKRHDWDSYFRDARSMDEKKAGERPDTIHISNLPIRWFCPRHQENEDNVKPSESIFRRIFEKFGQVRAVDIPICDPFRKDMKSHMTGMKTFSFDQDLYFEGYIQFSEYFGFVKTMDELRGMKLIRKEGDKNLAINIAVDFDTTKHLSDASIKRRRIIRERLIAKENARLEEEKKKQDEEEAKKEKERQRKEELEKEELRKQQLREEKRKEKYLKKLREEEEQQLNSKIKSEEKKLLIAQRKLESIRVLEAIFERIKLKNSVLKNKIKKERDDDSSHKKKSSSSSTTKSSNASQPFDLRNKLIKRVKNVQEQEFERQINRIKKIKSGTVLGTALNKDSSPRSPSVNSISSGDSILSDTALAKKRQQRKAYASPENEATEDNTSFLQHGHGPGGPGFPIYNHETGQWLGMGMYPFPTPFFPTAAIPPHEYYQNSSMPYRGYRGGGYRGRYMRGGRNRGHFKGRGGDYSQRYGNNDYDEYDNGHDSRRSRSRSRRRDRRRSTSRSRRRSRSRSHSRSRSRTKDRSRSKERSRRSYSRSPKRHSKRSRTHSRSRTKSQTHGKSRKLASTLRRSRSSSSEWSRSRSRSRHNRRSWSKSQSPRKSRSKSHATPPPKEPKRSDERDERSRFRDNKHKEKNRDKADKSSRKRSRSHSSRTNKEDDNRKQTKTPSKSPSPDHSRSQSRPHSQSRSRSKSIDSSTFRSPKRKEPSVTPEKEWN